jgi:peroxiredoxin
MEPKKEEMPVEKLPPKEAPAKKLPFASDFKLQDLSQNTYALSSYKDKQPVALFFWTTWCPFCRRELKLLNERYLELRAAGLEVLAIDVGEAPYRVESFMKNYALSFKVLLDKDTSVATAYDILGVPTYVLVDKKGHIVFKDNYLPENYKTLILE